jgi:hypothetical protein
MSDEYHLRFSQPVLTQRAATTTMDTNASKAWNDWAIALVRNEIRAREEVLIDSTVQWVREFVAEQVKDLEAEVASLRADQTIERAHRVIDLPDFRKRRA